MGAEKKSKIKGIREKWAWAERKWSEVTEDTGIGNPKKASPEKGRLYFEDVTDKVADLIVEICEVKPGKFYG
jgi:creatinine amidohydrolase